MKFCMQCGHELGASRTCPGCGTMVAVEPLPAPQLPPAGARYPLFADELVGATVNSSGRLLATPVTEPVAGPVAQPATRPTAQPTAPPSAPAAVPSPSELTRVDVVPHRSRPGGPLWLAAAALVLLVLALGTWLLLRGLGGSASSDGTPDTASGGAASGKASDVAETATATAPVTDKPGVDTAGNKTSYAASNMVDGDPTTTWRMAGDGTGTVLTFTLAKETTLSKVGLVNGYAKTGEQGGEKLDWYAGNRRVLAVEWLFDDGTTVPQRLSDTRDLQQVPVDVTTKTVRLRLVEVSSPGTGKAARDTTPVSEVSLLGAAE